MIILQGYSHEMMALKSAICQRADTAQRRTKVQECDATDDAMKYKSRAPQKKIGTGQKNSSSNLKPVKIKRAALKGSPVVLQLNFTCKQLYAFR
ncbi:MAG TPA: hypothetical protein PLA68_14305, partial [Panacibacter sp.]|nr:hypothetical protein [Panacibacter sp.]